jgi:ribosome-binding factor A
MNQRKDVHKKDRLVTKIQQEINMMFRKVFEDQRLKFVSVTKVELNQDYSRAKIFWDTYDSSKVTEVEKAMEASKSRIRCLLAPKLKIRQVPELAFYYDSQYEAEQSITKILQAEQQLGKYEKAE